MAENVEDEYIKCVEKLAECVRHLREINRKLDTVCKVPMEDIFIIEGAVEDMKHHLEQSIEDK